MVSLRTSEDLRPVTDLKLGASEVVGQAERTGRPVVLTRHGKGVAVLLSLSAFEDMQARLAAADLRAALAEGEADVVAGRTHTHAHILKKYLGE